MPTGNICVLINFVVRAITVIVAPIHLNFISPIFYNRQYLVCPVLEIWQLRSFFPIAINPFLIVQLKFILGQIDFISQISQFLKRSALRFNLTGQYAIFMTFFNLRYNKVIYLFVFISLIEENTEFPHSHHKVAVDDIIPSGIFSQVLPAIPQIHRNGERQVLRSINRKL